MAKFDYNSSSFRNAAIDKMNTRFGNGTPEKRQMEIKSQAPSNPFTNTKNPLKQPLINTKVDRPTAPKPATAGSKPETKPTTPAAKPAAAPAAPKTKQQVKQEVKAKVAAAKGEKRLARIEGKSAMTDEQKAAKSERFGKAVKGTLEAAGTALGLYATYQGIKSKNNSNSQEGN
jgi:type IV secretory pathway VirB10-like protein